MGGWDLRYRRLRTELRDAHTGAFRLSKEIHIQRPNEEALSLIRVAAHPKTVARINHQIGFVRFASSTRTMSSLAFSRLPTRWLWLSARVSTS